MKTVFFPFILISFILGTFLYGLNEKKNTSSVIYEQQGIPFCGPASLGNIIKNENGKFVTALPGWGRHAYKISTSNDSAQFYFNQGLSMYYSYHMKEALASFKEASRFERSTLCLTGDRLWQWGRTTMQHIRMLCLQQLIRY